MRIFICGMQSSGASLFAYFLAQKVNTVGVIDLRHRILAPNLRRVKTDVVLKATITTWHPLLNHLKSFKPNKKVLFVRNPYDNFVSLRSKGYADKSGKMLEKFSILDDVLSKNKFDVILKYEDFVLDHKATLDKLSLLNFGVNETFYEFRRDKAEIKKCNVINSKWCRHHLHHYGWGNMHVETPLISLGYMKKEISKTDISMVNKTCPNICKLYGLI